MSADLFGACPVYYTVDAGGSVRTARSVWPLLAAKPDPALDTTSVARALCRDLPAERTLFRDVGRVPPGHVLVFSSGGATLRREWTPPSPDEAHDAHTPEALLRLLGAAVRRLRPSGTAACTLSGGIDSATVLALLARQGSVRAYTLADDFAPDAEAEGARGLARRHSSVEHVLVPVREEDLPDQMPAAVAACEDVLYNARAIASHVFFKALHGHGASVVFSGTGADELLAGHPPSLASFDARRAEEAHLARSLLRPAALRAAGPVPAPEAGQDPALGRLRLVGAMLPELTLPPECRASRAAGLDLRLPFLEPDVADFALRAPMRLLLRDGLGKHLLREAVRGLVPEDTRLRPKSPRLAAGTKSPRARARWLERFDAALCDERLDALGPFDTSRVRSFRDGFGRSSPEDPGSGAREAVLMRLASLTELQDVLEKKAWPASS